MFALILALACGRNTVEELDADGDGVVASEDCDDMDPGRFPGAAEVCDGVDNNCDGEVDEGVLSTFYADADGDGHGGAEEVLACTQPEGSALESTDCDDGNWALHPGAVEVCDGLDNDCDGDLDDADADWDTGSGDLWFVDGDSDGFGDPAAPIEACWQPENTVRNDMDCDDTQALASPLGVEVCDGLDNDCDGETDPVSSLDATDFYADLDGDSFGDPSLSVTACAAPLSYVSDATDCDDGDGGVHPGAAEVCDTVDNDCDGQVDPSTSVDAGTWYRDRDGDGYGDPDAEVQACVQPEIYVADAQDCQDLDAAVFPGADEVCDGQDNDCDGLTDPSTSLDAETWYADTDADGFGDPASSQLACEQPSGSVSDASDCDDGDGTVNPDASEVCDGVDNDCDGSVDPATSTDASTWYADVDLDGYGDGDSAQAACDQPSGYVADDSDCDDSQDTVNPGATEFCDGLDNDCDASTLEAGTVSWTDSSGVSDVTSAWNGSSGAPAVLSYASAGTLSVCEGTWYVDLTLSADVELLGMGEEPEDVVLDGAGLNTVVEIDTAGTAVALANLSIENGAADVTLVGQTGAGGVNVDVAASLDLDAVTFQDNSGGFGGALALSSSTLSATDLVVSGNAAERGSGLFLYLSTATVDGYEESDCVANTLGGGVYLDGSTATLTEVASVGCSLSHGTGRGGWMYASNATVDVEDSAVSAASAYYGGAIYARSTTLNLLDTTIQSNSASYGGGIYMSAGTLSLDGAHVDYNTASLYGGGAYGSSGATLTCDGSTAAAGFWGNSGGVGGGGVFRFTTVTATSCDFGSSGSASDNSPSDVRPSSATYSYGDAASFTCTSTTCS